ncbi:MAG: TIGR01459 family HAD-type hydrolase [Alphaproteobacteria bacterium]|nr:TIGR01459 family HAD-type hydrolase [Alphaproteobacteria bacterium]
MQNLSRAYPVWLCDVWGVVHDGHKPFAAAVAALTRHRAEGGKVIFITNAPRPKAVIQAFIDHIGVPRSSYDDMVTSGDVTRDLMLHLAGPAVYHLGPEKDLPLFAGLAVQRVPLDEAGSVVCTGLFDELKETAEDYRPQLAEMLRRGLPMICANPDKVAQKGKLLMPCAGAIAEIYEAMGGKVLMAGKPFAPIYELALQVAGGVPKAQVLAIGDGPDTDIKGALQNGLACVFISGGINEGDDAEADVRRRYPRAKIIHAMRELYWS